MKPPIYGHSHLHTKCSPSCLIAKCDTNVTRSREMSHLSKISISIFLHHFLKTSKCFIFMQTPLQLDIWLQSYEGFVNANNIIKQRNLNIVLTTCGLQCALCLVLFTYLLIYLFVLFLPAQSVLLCELCC